MTTPNPKRAPLTEEQRANRASDIVDLIKSGYTAKAIAGDVHCSLSEVYQVARCAAVQFKRKHLIPEERREVAEFYRTHTLEETKAVYNLSAPSIIKCAKQAGVNKQPGRKPPGYVHVPPGEILRKCSLQILREEAKDQRVDYWLIRTDIETSKRMAIRYNPDVLALRKDAMGWIKENANRINEELK